MIHDNASFLITQPGNPSTCKVLHSTYPIYIFWQTVQYKLLCSVLAYSQPHSVTKSLFHNHFQVSSATFYFTTTLGCKVIITSTVAIVVMTCIIFQLVARFILLAFSSTQINFNYMAIPILEWQFGQCQTVIIFSAVWSFSSSFLYHS